MAVGSTSRYYRCALAWWFSREGLLSPCGCRSKREDVAPTLLTSVPAFPANLFIRPSSIILKSTSVLSQRTVSSSAAQLKSLSQPLDGPAQPCNPPSPGTRLRYGTELMGTSSTSVNIRSRYMRWEPDSKNSVRSLRRSHVISTPHKPVLRRDDIRTSFTLSGLRQVAQQSARQRSGSVKGRSANCSRFSIKPVVTTGPLVRQGNT
jgi:hypothetical protein